MSEHVTIHYHSGQRVEPACPIPQSAPADPLRAALESVLLFFDAGHWDTHRHQAWINRTHSSEATTRVLCDTVRAALATTGEPRRPRPDPALTCPQALKDALALAAEAFANDTDDEEDTPAQLPDVPNATLADLLDADAEGTGKDGQEGAV